MFIITRHLPVIIFLLSRYKYVNNFRKLAYYYGSYYYFKNLLEMKHHHVILVGSLNLIVHVVMYTYYFLAAMGPQIQKYLWWKVYLTRLQLVQFMIAILYFVCLFIFDCSFPKVFTSYVILNITFFLYLFTMFYLKTYKKVKPE